MRQLVILTTMLLFVLSVSSVCQAQTTIKFTYDDSGNRDTRSVITLKSTTIPTDSVDGQFLKPIDEKIGLQDARIYPNPTKGQLIIDFPSLQNQELQIRVYNSNGKLIIQRQVSGSNQIDLSTYSAGSYIMVITDGTDKKEWKIIKE